MPSCRGASPVWLREVGHDALHTLDLPEGNRTTDQSIIALSLREHRVVVTKDADFVAGFVLRNEPERRYDRGEVRDEDALEFRVGDQDAVLH